MCERKRQHATEMLYRPRPIVRTVGVGDQSRGRGRNLSLLDTRNAYSLYQGFLMAFVDAREFRRASCPDEHGS